MRRAEPWNSSGWEGPEGVRAPTASSKQHRGDPARFPGLRPVGLENLQSRDSAAAPGRDAARPQPEHKEPRARPECPMAAGRAP